MATLSFKALAPAAQRAGERASWHTDQMRTDWGVPLLPLSNMTNRETLGGGRVSYVIERRSEVDEWVMWAPGPTRETGHSGKLPLVNYRTALGQLRALNMGGFMGRGIYAGIPAHTALWGEGSLQGYQHTQRVWLRFQRWLSRIWSAVSQYLSFTPVVMPYAIQPTQGEFSLAFFLHNKLGHAILWEVNYLTSWRCLMTVPLGTPVRVSCTPSMPTNEKKIIKSPIMCSRVVHPEQLLLLWARFTARAAGPSAKHCDEYPTDLHMAHTWAARHSVCMPSVFVRMWTHNVFHTSTTSVQKNYK